MSCPDPIDAAVLADYWLGALADREEESVEEHLLGCDDCGDQLREVIALAEEVRNLARGGDLRMIVSDAFLKHAAEQGLHIREYAPPPGGSVQCTVTAEDDILIGRLAANFSAAKRVDLYICDDRGTERLRQLDIPFNSTTTSVAFQYPIAHAKASPTEKLIARLVAFDDSGRESLLGEYIFNHIRTLPGPAAW